MTSRVSSFYHFELAQHALFLGWDMEESMHEFFAKLPEELPKTYSTLKNDEKSEITISDVLSAISGNFTDAFKTYMSGVLTLVDKYEEPEDKTVFCAMHSGGSDYLFVKDIREFVEQVGCGSNVDSNPTE